MLAEDLLMLLYDADTGRPVIHSSKVDLALGGALIAELTQRQRIELTKRHGVSRNSTVIVVDPAPTGDDVLDEALQRIIDGRSTRSHVVVARISKGLRGRLLNRLAIRGLLKSEDRRFAFVPPTRSWPAVDTDHTNELKRNLQQVLHGEKPPTRQEAAIIALLHAVGRTANVLGDPKLDRRQLKRRAKTVAEDDPIGRAVRQALNAAAF